MVTGKRCSEWRGLYPSGYCYRHVDQGPYEARMLLRGLRHPGEPKPAAVRYSTVVENSGAVYIAQEVVVRTRGEDLWHLKVGKVVQQGQPWPSHAAVVNKLRCLSARFAT